jgi:hypothetical protein
MHSNGTLLSQEKADRMQHIRAEIGRRLREHFDAGARPMPERLAELIKKIQHPNGLCEERGPTSGF